VHVDECGDVNPTYAPRIGRSIHTILSIPLGISDLTPHIPPHPVTWGHISDCFQSHDFLLFFFQNSVLLNENDGES